MERRAPSRVALFCVLAVAVVGISLAAPLIQLAKDAPPLAIAFWRMALSTALTGSLWLGSTRRSGNGRGFGRREWALALLAGIFLAVHFGTWIASLKLITVAASVVLVNTQPIFAIVLATLFLKERATRRQWCGIGIAVLGATYMTFEAGEDGSVSGHLLALTGAATWASYNVIGRHLRQKTPLWAYVTRVYGVSAVVLLFGSVTLGTRLAPYPLEYWLIFLALAVGPSLLGHTLLNWSLRWLEASVVSVVALGESLGAACFAALFFGEVPGQQTVIGGAITLLGIAVVVAKRSSAPSAPS